MSIEDARNGIDRSMQELNAAVDVNEDIGRLQQLSLAHSEVATIRLKDAQDVLPAYLYHASEAAQESGHREPSLVLANKLGGQVINSLDRAINHLAPALDNEDAASRVGSPENLQSLRGRINVADIRYIAAMHDYSYVRRVERNFHEARGLATNLSELITLSVDIKIHDADQFGFTGIRKSVDLLQRSTQCPPEQFPVILEAALEAITQQDMEFVQELHKTTSECGRILLSSVETTDSLMEVFGELLKDLGTIKRRL